MNNIVLSKSKVIVQKVGTSLSGMIMPIIGIIIAWGLLTAFFIPTGWTPVDVIDKYIVGNTITFLIPILIGFLGGKRVYGSRGGFIGAAATLGVIVGAKMFESGTFYEFIKDTKLGVQFLGAMIMGPLAAFVLKKIESIWAGKIRPGFEMLVDNFSMGIIGATLMLFGFFVMPFGVYGLTYILEGIVNPLTEHKALPVTSIFVEPAKPLFLNNAINHGVFTPLGANEVKASGQSLLFYIESNPGPGMGILLAYMLMDRKQRGSASSASIIHFFGGIHEVYFPFIIMKPILVIAAMLGGASGVAVMQAFGTGAVSAASPGSIIALFTVSANSAMSYAGLALGITVSLAVSFTVAVLLMKFSRKNKKISADEAINKMNLLKGSKSKHIKESGISKIKEIIFACDAGMGSSKMGAGILRKLVHEKNPNIKVHNVAIRDLNKYSPDLIVVQRALADRARAQNLTKQFIVDNFLDKTQYLNLVKSIPDENALQSLDKGDNKIKSIAINLKNIIIKGTSIDMENAIKETGQVLYKNKFIKKAYIESMLKRNEDVSVYIGNGVAIPHGQSNSENLIYKDGISLITYPKGIKWYGETVYIVIGISSKNSKKMDLLSELAIKLSEEKTIEKIIKAKTKDEIRKALS